MIFTNKTPEESCINSGEIAQNRGGKSSLELQTGGINTTHKHQTSKVEIEKSHWHTFHDRFTPTFFTAISMFHIDVSRFKLLEQSSLHLVKWEITAPLLGSLPEMVPEANPAGRLPYDETRHSMN